jgi:hypothetical protein
MRHMHIPLYQALKSIKISDEQAAAVVGSFEEHMAVKISEATKGLQAQLKALTWLLGYIGAVLTIMGLAPAIAKLF